MTRKRKLKKNVRIKSLYPQFNTKVRRDLLDADYINKLTPEEKRWYAQFIDEYVGGSIEKTKTGKVKSGHLHNTKALAKECYDANNRRNVDIMSVTKANRLLSAIDPELDTRDGWYITNPQLTEDSVISGLDKQEQEELSLAEYITLKNNFNKERQTELESKFIEDGYNIKFILDLHAIHEKHKLSLSAIKRVIKKPKSLEKFR